MHDAQLSALQGALRERFVIKREIGSGAYGTVFLAEDAHRRTVALKVLSPEVLSVRDRARMLSELGMLSRLSHPHLLPILEAGEAADLIYYSTPFVAGGSLEERLDKGPLALPEALQVAKEIADALEYADSHGVVHRNIAPHNVLFDSGRALVKDFWIARALANALSDRSLTGAGPLFGTPVYMSPEQLGGAARVDSRSDVYALAVLICEMLTKQLPFAGRNAMGIPLLDQLSGPGPSRRDLPPTLPPRISAAILQALAGDPKDRFANAQELVRACSVGLTPTFESAFLSRDFKVVPGSPQVLGNRTMVWAQAPPSQRPRLRVGIAVLVPILVLAVLLFQRHTASSPNGGAGPGDLLPILLLSLALVGGALFVAGEALRRRKASDATRRVRTIRAAPEPIERVRAALRYRYEIRQEIGRGGMALVFLAHDLRYRGRKVALKVLRPELAITLASERFLQEIEIAALLTHPGILPLFDSGDAEGLPFYVMPYIEGESLRSRLVRESRLALGDALSTTRDVARALDYAHGQQIVHRDIKPENILFNQGLATVADFGIALALDRARETATGQSLGTPAFMSPEQFWDTAHIDHRTDLYSLGCVLYEMLAGVPPYSGTASQLASKHLTDPIPHIRLVRADVPESVDIALGKALAKDPVDRFDSGGSFVAALA